MNFRQIITLAAVSAVCAGRIPAQDIAKVEADLARLTGSVGLVEVFVILKDQPQEAIVRQHLEPVRPKIDALHDRISAQLRKGDPIEPSLAALVKERDLLELETRRRAVEEIRQTIRGSQESIFARLKSVGAAPERRFWIFNMISATVPGELIPVIAEWPEVLTVKLARQRTAMIRDSVPGTGVQSFW